MKPIEEITISGFRGIREPLKLGLKRGSETNSIVIYGRNGTGKSSITDAWEWFHSQRIEHLAREGARERSYPHKSAKKGETFVRIRFSDGALGSICMEYDHDRVTIPRIVGDIDSFRILAPHPCHIRFEDLTRFVYLTKADRYDALAQLMGFVPQVEFQKALKRVLRKLDEELQARTQTMQTQTGDLQEVLGIKRVIKKIVLSELNRLLENHGIGKAATLRRSEAEYRKLTKIVQYDPRAVELSSLRSIKQVLEDMLIPEELAGEIKLFFESVMKFKQEEKQSVDLLLLELYESGQLTLERLRELDQEVDYCPLCGQPFEGDLIDHIAQNLHQLRNLKKSRDAHEYERKKFHSSLVPFKNLAKELRKGMKEETQILDEGSASKLLHSAISLQETIRALLGYLSQKVEEISAANVIKMHDSSRRMANQRSQFEMKKQNFLSKVAVRTGVLEDDAARKSLVEDHATISTTLRAWEQMERARAGRERLKSVHYKFKKIVADYVLTSANDVQQIFEAISGDVRAYFDILEVNNPIFGEPTLKLLTDQDRAVELEIEFLGESIYPAYRYLSASQLNSFGLAIFLASTKYFNKNFKFLLLDDVINSFDGYKRPQVIILLKQEFSDYQIILLTHDSVWRDRLIMEFPRWARYRFRRWEPEIGPIVDELKLPLEVIEQLINDDEPVRAGRNMGPFLERELQYLAENFEVEVKYNRRNEYTLAPLMERFRVRVGKKLSSAHPLYRDVVALEQESGFRNLSAHWKRPEINITPEEMQAVVEKWKVVEASVRCPLENCYSYVNYVGERAFMCPCGSTRLERIT